MDLVEKKKKTTNFSQQNKPGKGGKSDFQSCHIIFKISNVQKYYQAS